MYLRALFDGLFAEPPVDARRRDALATWFASRPTADLRRWVEEIDPDRASLGRTQLLRALEVALLTGYRISELHRHTGSTITVRGWVQHVRSSGKVAFVVVRDGSGIVQAVLVKSAVPAESFSARLRVSRYVTRYSRVRAQAGMPRAVSFLISDTETPLMADRRMVTMGTRCIRGRFWARSRASTPGRCSG